MLVLSRKEQQSLQIGPDVTVTIVRIGPETVRLGITAPKDMTIVRTETEWGMKYLQQILDDRSKDDQ